jgi:hypothetical protein
MTALQSIEWKRTAGGFFVKCPGCRSRLQHGSPGIEPEELDALVERSAWYCGADYEETRAGVAVVAMPHGFSAENLCPACSGLRSCRACGQLREAAGFTSVSFPMSGYTDEVCAPCVAMVAKEEAILARREAERLAAERAQKLATAETIEKNATKIQAEIARLSEAAREQVAAAMQLREDASDGQQ